MSEQKLIERMTPPIDGPLTKPVMTVSEAWYLARLEEVGDLAAKLETTKEGLEDIQRWARSTALRARHSEVLLVVERICANTLAAAQGE